MNSIASRLADVRQRIARAETAWGRTPGSVTLLAVSKTQPVAAIREALLAGQRFFGESYLQEALAKIEALQSAGVEWHYIGSIQSNKTRDIAARFDWVHGVDRLNIAERLSAQRPAHLPPLNICLQVNLSGEASKSGLPATAVAETAAAVSTLPNLTLRGLMTLPAPEDDFDKQRIPFRRLHELQTRLNTRGMQLDTLSMGMSDDLEAAIAEGATLVRIGTAIFGPRG